MARFFLDKSTIDKENGIAVIVGDDAHHIARSLRMAEGETVTICDGEGTDYVCRLDTIRDTEVRASILSSGRCPSEPPYSLTVYQALVKGDRMDTVIQKSVENGANRIVPFDSSRCIMKEKPEKGDSKEQRRSRIAAEAAKQCGRGSVPKVSAPVTFKEMLAEAGKADLKLFCYEDEKQTSLAEVLAKTDLPKSVAIVVGPEGGFSPEEAAQAVEAGLVPVSLGHRILRTESAAPFVLACLCCKFEM